MSVKIIYSCGGCDAVAKADAESVIRAALNKEGK